MNTGLMKQEKASRTLFFVCWIVYAIICMTKNAFGASMASIIGEGFLTKSLAGTVNASYYVFYGLAQLVFAGIVDRISPVKLVNMALVGSVVSLAGFAVTDSFYVMLFLWSVAGLLQFAIWPAVIRIMSEYLVPSHRGKAMVYIAFAYCTGMLTNYGVASVILRISDWRMIFKVFLVIIVVTFFVWVFMTKKTVAVLEQGPETKKKTGANSDSKGMWKVLVSSGVVFLLIPACIRTMMDMGLKSWVPTMLTESYGVSASFASALTTILLLVNLFGVYIVRLVYPKYIKNEVTCFGLCFVISIPFTLLLLLTGKIPVGVVVVLLTLVTTFMYAGHQLINVIIPSKFARVNLSGSVAAVLNAIASFGVVIASFGYGYLAENFGWTVTIMSWSIMAVVAAVLALLSVGLWQKFSKN